MKTLVGWLASLEAITDPKPVRVRIGRRVYIGASYVRTDHGAEEWLYLLGPLPASYVRSRKVAYRFAGDARDWFIAGWNEATKPETAQFHPHGPYFLLCPWKEDGIRADTGEPYEAGPIDRYEETPYRRMTIARGFEPQTVIPYPFPFSVGPRIIRNVICSDGIQRTARCSSSGADTFFSIPATVRANGRSVSGFVTRETLQGWDTETEGDPAVWKFIAYSYGKNANVLPTGAYKEETQ